MCQKNVKAIYKIESSLNKATIIDYILYDTIPPYRAACSVSDLDASVASWELFLKARFEELAGGSSASCFFFSSTVMSER